MQPKSPFRAILVTTWAVLTFVCFLVVMPSIGKDPSVSESLASEWPASTKLTKVTNVGHLIVFVHPYCPCTTATLRNLEDALDSTNHTVSIVQLRTARLESLHVPVPSIARIVDKNGWSLVLDNEGVEASTFGATTSGECMLFTPSGALLFAGGITASRGHQGDNQGLATLKGLMQQISPKMGGDASPNEAVYASKNSKWANFPTFGCPLFGETGCGRESSACQEHAF